MKHSWVDFIILKFNRFLSKTDSLPTRTYLYDFDKMAQGIRPCDVLLVNSHTHIGNIIRLISESPWTHAALYIGKIKDLEDTALQEKIRTHIQQQEGPDFSSDQLLIEGIMGKGTVISSLEKYKGHQIRIVRPTGLLSEDVPKVLAHAINQIGRNYSVRHLFDLARFILPWHILPRKWRSSIFQQNALQPTEDICSSMIAKAFQSVSYPILPLIEEEKADHVLIRRNPYLYTPSDFDYSPFFDIIKYPIFSLKEGMRYHDLHWKKRMMSDDIEIIRIMDDK